jgi:hypothetical protein
MKNTKIELTTQSKEIDWSVPMWVVSDCGNIIVLTIGSHSDNKFQGTALPCKDYPNGDYCKSWDKSSFNPLKAPLTITISN